MLLAMLCLTLACAPAAAEAWQLPTPPSGPENSRSPAKDKLPREAVDPEPIEGDSHYAKICDAFGEGFVYSPGTGGCIKIGGYVKFGTSFGGRR